MTKEIDDLITIEDRKFAVENKNRLSSARAFRSGLWQLAAYLRSAPPETQGLFFLKNPEISPERLEELKNEAKALLNKSIWKRIHILATNENEIETVAGGLKDLSKIWARLASETDLPAEGAIRLPKPEYKFEILKVLVNRWLLNQGTVTSTWLGETVGCTYPTVKRALDEFELDLERDSDRSVALKYIPEGPWEAAQRARTRLSFRYADRSGKPRSAADLKKRLKKLSCSNIALSGTAGARYWDKDIDLTGDPRLDLCVHAPEDYVVLDFIERLDPALERTETPSEKPSVVVHILRRKNALFATNGERWADPAECLMDLNAMQLGTQAREFVHRLREKDLSGTH